MHRGAPRTGPWTGALARILGLRWRIYDPRPRGNQRQCLSNLCLFRRHTEHHLDSARNRSILISAGSSNLIVELKAQAYEDEGGTPLIPSYTSPFSGAVLNSSYKSF